MAITQKVSLTQTQRTGFFQTPSFLVKSNDTGEIRVRVLMDKADFSDPLKSFTVRIGRKIFVWQGSAQLNPDNPKHSFPPVMAFPAQVEKGKTLTAKIDVKAGMNIGLQVEHVT